MDEWYSYGEFQFRRDEILWALRNADLMREGKWPPQNIPTGYIDPGIRRKGVKREPAFVKPAIIMAEIDWRIKLTGVDGLHIDAKLLLAEVEAGYERFSEEAWGVLNYISGNKKRLMSYPDWKKQRRYRLKGGYMSRFNNKQDLTKIQIEERAKKKRNRRR